MHAWVRLRTQPPRDWIPLPSVRVIRPGDPATVGSGVSPCTFSTSYLLLEERPTRDTTHSHKEAFRLPLGNE